MCVSFPVYSRLQTGVVVQKISETDWQRSEEGSPKTGAQTLVEIWAAQVYVDEKRETENCEVLAARITRYTRHTPAEMQKETW